MGTGVARRRISRPVGGAATVVAIAPAAIAHAAYPRVVDETSAVDEAGREENEGE